MRVREIERVVIVMILWLLITALGTMLCCGRGITWSATFDLGLRYLVHLLIIRSESYRNCNSELKKKQLKTNICIL